MKWATTPQAQRSSNGTMMSDGRERQDVHRRLVGIALWFVGAVLLIIAGIVIRMHPAPWPVELNFTKTIQGSHPIPCAYSQQHRSWLDTDVDFINKFDDPVPSIVIPLAWMVVLAVVRWFWQVLFLGVAVLSGSTLWGGLTMLIDRPRPRVSLGICVHRMINAFSFPSGHVIHDGVLYGFLLYLSFTRPMRTWRYHWVLLPFQILAVLYLLAVGYSRIRSGEHWLFDVLGGYLTAALWLFFLIFLYRGVAHLWTKYREGHIAE